MAYFLSLFLFFVWSLIPTCGGIIVSIILSSLGQCSNNDDHHTLIYLQLKNYNSILRNNMTLCGCLRQCTGICNESRVTCMKEILKWLCYKYDVNYVIMQKQYDNDGACHNKQNGGKLHGNISRMAMEMPL